jgi:hypothetical protein
MRHSFFYSLQTKKVSVEFGKGIVSGELRMEGEAQWNYDSRRIRHVQDHDWHPSVFYIQHYHGTFIRGPKR